MNRTKVLQHIIHCSLAILFLMGCNSALSTTATPTPGIGVPVSVGNWEVTISNVHKTNEWSNNQPKSGYIFLVVDATFHSLDSTQETKIASKTVAIIDGAGQITVALGWGIPDNSNIDIMEIGDLKENPNTAGITGGFGFVPSFESKGDTLTATYVFILTEESIIKPLKFQFQDVQIPFTLSK